MLLIVLAYLGGALTILSPCILPVLPFVFARADQPFVRSGLPLLAGMALTFAIVATLAAVRSDDPQPVPPAGAALCLRARRSPFRAQRAAIAGRHGADFRHRRDPRRRGRRLGHAG